MQMKHKTYFYAEHTGSAGQRCFDDDLIERESDDVFAIEGTPAELREVAGLLEKSKKRFDWAVARGLREVLAEAASDRDI